MSTITGADGSILVAAAVLGAGTAGGAWLMLTGARRTVPAPDDSRLPLPRRLMAVLPDTWRGRRLMLALLAGAGVGLFTHWPVAGVMATATALVVPQLLAPDKAAKHAEERMEAVAVFAEMLRDTLAAAAGLEQALLACAEVAPAALRREIEGLAARLKDGQSLPEALEAFAAEVGDPGADLVVVALKSAAERQAGHLGALLGELAEAVREQVAMRQRIAATRASSRTAVRMITLTTLVMAIGLMVLNRPYLQPFDSALGQLVLAAAGVIFAGALGWLHAMARFAPEPRVLSNPEAGAAALVVPPARTAPEAELDLQKEGPR